MSSRNESWLAHRATYNCNSVALSFLMDLIRGCNIIDLSYTLTVSLSLFLVPSHGNVRKKKKTKSKGNIKQQRKHYKIKSGTHKHQPNPKVVVKETHAHSSRHDSTTDDMMMGQ